MKTSIIFLLITISSGFTPPKDTIMGTWKCVRARYGNSEMKDRTDQDIYKVFTTSRWSSVFFNKAEKKFDGAGGGTYSLQDAKYTETIEYYSWDSEAVGNTFTFTLKIENGMLHQSGTITYKGDPNYIVDEW